jgi:hypothetical protein
MALPDRKTGLAEPVIGPMNLKAFSLTAVDGQSGLKIDPASLLQRRRVRSPKSYLLKVK